jgi:serine protease AprX
VLETSLFAQQECIHTVEVTDTSKPLKVTIVWMDPDNSIISEKMLLNDLNLRVLSPGGETLYGNNINGDEVNNVSHSPPIPPDSKM